MQDDMPLIVRAHPFSADPGIVLARPGQTIGQMLRGAIGPDDELAPLQVRVGGYEVPAAMWGRLRPKEGTLIEVTRLPEGSMNQNWASVLMIAVAIFAPYAGAAMAGAVGGSAAVWSAAFMVAGSLAVNALVKTPQALSQDEGRKWNELTGNSNQINPGGPIPHVLGEHRFFPPHAAMPYTVASAGHSYQYCLFDLGYNVEPDDVSDLRIGDTPISEFENITWQISKNPTIYKNDVNQLAIGIQMDYGVEVVRTTAPDTDSVMFDIIFPQGLWGTGTDGKKLTVSAYFDFYYRPAGTSTWLVLPSPTITGVSPYGGPQGMYSRTVNNHKDPLTVSGSFDLPTRGQVDIRWVRREPTEKPPDDQWVDTAILSSLLSIRDVPASRTDTLKIALRAQADNQLNGTMQNFSCHVAPKFPVYNESTGTWSRQRTTNAGWIYHYVLTSSPATIRKVAPERMHLDQVLDFVDFCENHEFECRMVVDTASTVGQVVDMVLRSSGGERTMTDGRYGVTFIPETEPMAEAEYAPTEVDDFTLTRTFAKIPHALKVKFRNPEADWQPDEIMVLDDGYSYRGVDARGNPSSLPEPTEFETLDLQATMLPQQAWRLGRMHFAQGKFSAATYSWRSDVSALKMTKGTPVTVAHDVPQWGAGAGRVVSLTAGGPTGVATLVLDAEVETDPAKSYRMQIRGPNGTQAVNCTPHSPFSATFYLHAMPTGVQAGDVGIVGDTEVDKPLLLVTSMRGNMDLEFEVAAVAWDERIAPYWANPPENIVSEVSGRAYTEAPDPPVITVDGGSEEDDDAGIRTPVINIGHWDVGGRYEPLFAEQLR